MRLTFLGKDSTPGDSPTLYATDEDSYVVQGWKVAPVLVDQLGVSEGQTVVEVPPGLMQYLAVDGLHGEVVNLVPPIVHVTDAGTFIVLGDTVPAEDVRAQMKIPSYEDCVQVPKAALAHLLGG